MSIEGTCIIREAGRRPRRQVGEYKLSLAGPGGKADEVTVVSQLRFRVGSNQGNDLVVDDGSVSRFHIEIVAEPDGYQLRDLDSTNGTWIDGLRVKDAYIPDRARLRLGNVTLGFEAAAARRDLPASDDAEYYGVVGRSAPMRELFAQLDRVAPTDATVLIEGESGTGKELIARAVHSASKRSDGPMVTFDCAAVPATLLESELFGHERGAFTGADSSRIGRFEEADGGTLFLDELGEMPLELQPKLLRVLENRTVRRVGARSERQVDVRLVAATNRDLAREVNQGTFRADLYYRLAVVPLRLTPLRDRPEDIRPLVEHFVHDVLDEPERASRILNGISDANWQRMEGLPWRGNVRELRNFIERTLALSDGPTTDDLPSAGAARKSVQGLPSDVDLDRAFTTYKADMIASFERAYLFGQLERHDNNISAAARASGLDRMNFKRLLRKYR